MTAMGFFHSARGPARFDRPASRTWANETATWLQGRAALDDTDALAIELERKWGCGRLRLLVSTELRARFDSQRWKLAQAQWHGGLEDVVREAGRMARAWRALDTAAEAGGAAPLSPEVWELSLSDGPWSHSRARAPRGITSPMIPDFRRHLQPIRCDWPDRKARLLFRCRQARWRESHAPSARDRRSSRDPRVGCGRASRWRRLSEAPGGQPRDAPVVAGRRSRRGRGIPSGTTPH